jgi:hypothetical protein
MAAGALSLPPQVRQLGDIDRDPPRLIASHPVGSLSMTNSQTHVERAAQGRRPIDGFVDTLGVNVPDDPGWDRVVHDLEPTLAKSMT